MNNELKHHGVLGQKWGVRRYQNADGTLTKQGKEHYNTGSAAGHVARAVLNGSLGQRIGTTTNRGYQSDKKEIDEKYKKLKESGKYDSKEKLKELKNDYKLTKAEARVSAAEALYPYQSKSTNEKIQTQNLGKAYVKSWLLGEYGSLTYDRIRANNGNRGEAYVGSVIASGAQYFTGGVAGVGDYALRTGNYNRKHK